MVIDLESGKGRTVDLERGWLPSVDPSGRFVVYWRGQLADRDGVATPDDGRLYVADWTNLDPWPAPRAADGATQPTTTVPESSTEPAAGRAGRRRRRRTTPPVRMRTPRLRSTSTSPAEASAEAPSSAPDGVGRRRPQLGLRRRTARRGGRPDCPTSRRAGDEAHERLDAVRPRAAAGGQRSDTRLGHPLVSRRPGLRRLDGRARVPGCVATLVVRSAPSADAPTGASLLERVQAGRSFGLGDQRVAWVAPLDAGDGELWVSVWGSRGQGSVKLRRRRLAGRRSQQLIARAGARCYAPRRPHRPVL